jgi:anhydro-N-acetylmuramic acid kinase
MATLSEMTAILIITTILQFHRSEIPMKLYFSGGGLSNNYLMQKITAALIDSNIQITDCKEKGINPDSKEAVMFALLANEALSGNPSIWKDIFPAVSFGKISFPS